MPSLKPMLYAHIEGHTDVCYYRDGRHLLSCGSDGDVRLWDGFDGDDSVSFRIGDRVYAVHSMGENFYASTDSFTIQAYTYPEGNPDGIVARFTAPVHHMVTNKSQKTMIACSSDFTIKIITISDCSYKTCRGHEAPVLSIALDPLEEFLASSSCDGTVRIWKLADQTEVAKFSILNKVNDVSFARSLCRLAWDQSNGKVLFIPVEKEIRVYERKTWQKIHTITEDDVGGVLSILSISSDNKCLAAASSEGTIHFFDVASYQCIDRYRHEKKFSITALVWDPKNKDQIVFCDKEKPAAETRVKETIGIFDDDDDDMLLEATDVQPSTIEDEISQDGNMDDDDDDDNNEKISKKLPIIDENGEIRLGDGDETGSIVSEPVSLPPPVQIVEGFKPTTPQPAFQAGSTPVHFTNRFMMWNSVGIIKQYNTDEDSGIDVEFHDTSIHHAMHLSDSSNYTMADLNTEAVILAGESDIGLSSRLLCMHFGSWDSTKEWTVNMPDKEEIKAIAIGEDWIAIATDQRNVRLFSIGGVQKEVFSIPGPVVCVAAHTNQLIIVYHRGLGLPGDQCMAVSLMCVDGKNRRNVLSDVALPLSGKAHLSWLGFSAEGTPFYMDSAGILRMLNRQFGPSWTEVANTKSHTKGKSDHFFIVGINENPQQLRCIPCKGSRYPATLPRPAVTILPFKMPLCDITMEKGQYEDLLWRTTLFSQHFDHWTSLGFEFDESMKMACLKPRQEALMKLFALSVKTDCEYRALEVCEMMTEQHTLQLAIKYASRINHLHLAERISELAQRKMEEEMTQEEEEEIIEPVMQRIARRQEKLVEEVMDEGNDEIEVQREEDEEDEEEEEESKPQGPMLNLKPKQAVTSERPSSSIFSQGRTNPFRVSTPQKTEVKGGKGTQVFDAMSKKRAKVVSPPAQIKLTSKPMLKKGAQGKIVSTKPKSKKPAAEVEDSGSTEASEKTKSAFDIWLEENRTDIDEEFADMGEEDKVQEAAQRFRQLPKEEKQAYVQKAKQLKEENEENTDSTCSENKKRKRTDDDIGIKEDKELANKKLKESSNMDRKKPLSQSTNSKLSSFSFNKDPS